jgi:hypothetical protein
MLWDASTLRTQQKSKLGGYGFICIESQPRIGAYGERLKAADIIRSSSSSATPILLALALRRPSKQLVSDHLTPTGLDWAGLDRESP